MNRLAALLAVLLLAGCASAPQRDITEPAAPGSRYVVEPGREPAKVAEMRAAPAPERAGLEDGKSRAGDHRRLAAKGLVSIGTGYFPGPEPEARAAAIAQGQVVGAEHIVFYPPSAEEGDEWIAIYYVRFQLPFGATFRDLRAGERKVSGAGGVVLGSIVGGTPASRANLLSGDIVVKCDGKAIADRSAFQAMLRSRAGHPVTLTLVRNGETLERVVRLGVMAAEPH
jgi:membrane-associated protease RseP (regulator of RpoE activity)